MKRSTTLALAAIATLGLGAAAAPVAAQQMKHDGSRQGMNMHSGHQAMMGGGMEMMMGGNRSYAMTAFDTNKDGALSAEEIKAGVQSELATYDANGDGALSLDEFAAMHAAHTRRKTVRAFQMHDYDGDAQVTKAEMEEMASMMVRRMSGAETDMPEMEHGAPKED